MNIYQKSLEIAKVNNGIITARKAREANIPSSYLINLVKKEKLIKIDRGIFVLPNTFDDNYYYYQNRYRRGIYSHDTALYLHNLSVRTPLRFVLTFPQGYNTSNIKKNKLIKPITSTHYDLGITTIDSPYGNELKIYNIERTICNLLQKTYKVSFETIKHGITQYLKEKKVNINELMNYSKIFSVEKELSIILKVLL